MIFINILLMIALFIDKYIKDFLKFLQGCVCALFIIVVFLLRVTPKIVNKFILKKPVHS